MSSFFVVFLVVLNCLHDNCCTLVCVCDRHFSVMLEQVVWPSFSSQQLVVVLVLVCSLQSAVTIMQGTNLTG